MSSAKTITNADSPFTLTKRHYLVLCDCTAGPITVNLPAASLGYPYMIIKSDSSANAVTISSGDTINGASTMTLGKSFQGVTLTSDKTQYIVKSQSNESIRVDSQ